MTDKEKRAHDLAIAAAAVSSLKNFDVEVRGNTPTEKRSSFADSLQDEYKFFLKYYLTKSE